MPRTHDRRQFLKTIGVTGAILAGGVGATSARPAASAGSGPGSSDAASGGGPSTSQASAGTRQGARPGPTIVDIAASNDDFSILVAAVQKAGLVDALSGNRQLTVFAPTNAAFEDLLAATPYDSLDDIPVGTLRNVLLYHVTPGRRYAASVVRAPQVPTLQGSSIDVDGTTLDGGEGSIVATDIEATNGVIHVIDGVLLP